MQSIFERCRGIPASEAARREGIQLTRRGSREWACCPFHGEKTASMMFDENGKWHCFGCGQGGDAIAFTAKLHNLKPYEAAQRLVGEYGENLPPAPMEKPAGNTLLSRLETWFKEEWDAALGIALRAAAEAERVREETVRQGRAEEEAWDDPRFCDALLEKSRAEILLERLKTTDPDSLIALFHERQEEQSGSDRRTGKY